MLAAIQSTFRRADEIMEDRGPVGADLQVGPNGLQSSSL
jgi:hypothetical protein